MSLSDQPRTTGNDSGTGPAFSSNPIEPSISIFIQDNPLQGTYYLEIQFRISMNEKKHSKDYTPTTSPQNSTTTHKNRKSDGGTDKKNRASDSARGDNKTKTEHDNNNSETSLDSDELIKQYASQLGLNWNCVSNEIPKYGNGPIKDGLLSELVSMRTVFLERKLQMMYNMQWEYEKLRNTLLDARRALHTKLSSGDYSDEYGRKAKKEIAGQIDSYHRKLHAAVESFNPRCEQISRRKLDAWFASKKKLHPKLVQHPPKPTFDQ